MSTPVVVSRIQNRRGTQSQFNGSYVPPGPGPIYPTGYNGIGGFGSVSGPLIATTSTSGTGSVATVSFAAATYLENSPIGSSVTITGVTPVGYNGIWTVTASSGTSVSFASATTGVQTVAGTITRPYNSINYPSVLLAGELALCTDSGRVFMGNINGEYLEISVI